MNLGITAEPIWSLLYTWERRLARDRDAFRIHFQVAPERCPPAPVCLRCVARGLGALDASEASWKT